MFSNELRVQMDFHKKVEEFVDEVCKEIIQEKEFYLQTRNTLKEQLWSEFEKLVREGKTEHECESLIFAGNGLASKLRNQYSSLNEKLTSRNKTRKIQYYILLPCAILISFILIFDTCQEFFLLKKIYTPSISQSTLNDISNISYDPDSTQSILRKAEASFLTEADYLYLTKREPENAYFDLLFFTNTAVPYSDSDNEVINEQAFNQKFDVIKKIITKKDYNPHRLDVKKAIDKATYPGYLRLNLKLMDSINQRIPYLSYVRNFRLSLRYPGNVALSIAFFTSSL